MDAYSWPTVIADAFTTNDMAEAATGREIELETRGMEHMSNSSIEIPDLSDNDDMNLPVAVIGDTHARPTLARLLLAELEAAGMLSGHRLVFLGDYIDRGPDARGMIDLCVELQAKGHVMLAGNHDFVLERAMFATEDREVWADRWKAKYERGLLESYGLMQSVGSGLELADELHEVMPLDHQEFLKDLPWIFENDTVIAIHAGPNPDTEWDVQSGSLAAQLSANPLGPEQLFLKPFAFSTDYLIEGKTLVTGHASAETPFLAPGRVRVDTGAGDFDGPLTAWVSDTDRLVSVEQ